jgi:hypothetical protein
MINYLLDDPTVDFKR